MIVGRQKKKEKKRLIFSYYYLCLSKREKKSLANERYVCIRKIHTSYSTPDSDLIDLYCSVPSKQMI